MAVSSQQVTVTTSATLLSIAPADNAPNSSVCVKVVGAGTVYLGGPGVTTANGYPLASTDGAIGIDLVTTGITGDPFTGTHTVDEALYGVVASSTAVVAVLATGV